jgi:hypothetical protein
MKWSCAADVNQEVLDTVNNSLRYSYASSAIELQRKAIETLESLHDRLRALRESSIAQCDEPYANAGFRAQMLVSATLKVMEMWVLLKDDKPHLAWDKLAEAQEALVIAQRVQFDPELLPLVNHLSEIEKVVFPPQMFFSSAYTYTEALCSICDGRYGECMHIAGRIYMGRICNRVIAKSELREISIVQNPQNKKCRVEDYAECGKAFCTLTGREVPQEKPIDPDVRFCSGFILRAD